MTTYRDRHLAGEYNGETETVQAEESVTEDAFVCDVCGLTFGTQHGLAIHQGKAHASEEIPA